MGKSKKSPNESSSRDDDADEFDLHRKAPSYWSSKSNKISSSNSLRKIEYVKPINPLNGFNTLSSLNVLKNDKNNTNKENKDINFKNKKMKDNNISKNSGLFAQKLLDDKREWKVVRQAGPGCMNFGNTCYLNSIVQCMFYIPSLTCPLIR